MLSELHLYKKGTPDEIFNSYYADVLEVSKKKKPKEKKDKSKQKKKKDTSQIFQTPDMGSPKQPAFIGMTEEEKKGLLESLYNLDSYV